MFGAPWLACQRAVSIRFICFLKFSVGRSGRGDSIPGLAAMPPKKSWKEKAVPKAMKAKKEKARKVKVPKAMKAKKKKIIDRIPAFDNAKRLRKRREWPSVQPMKVIHGKMDLGKIHIERLVDLLDFFVFAWGTRRLDAPLRAPKSDSNLDI